MAQEEKPLKIVLVTGYLGAGKTTLLNHVLANDQNLRAAVIVNDIGEVNIDASLIQNGGVSQMDDIIPLTNGCICCTLADDLAAQLSKIADSGDFDYIIIEASGICEPLPIAYTISQFCESRSSDEAPIVLDNIVAVVDCARMLDEFSGGKDLLKEDLEEDDLESLLIDQIEFCTTVVLTKTDLIDRAGVDEVRAIVRSLQKDAKIIEVVNGETSLDEILDTGRFNFEDVYQSAAWIDYLMNPEEEGDPEVLEYNITTFVYERRKPFDIDKLGDFAANWPPSVIRTKGMAWVDSDPDTCFLFEQAGQQRVLSDNGLFVAALPENEQQQVFDEVPDMLNNWDPVCGDRMTKLVFIGRDMDRAEVEAGLDACLTDWEG